MTDKELATLSMASSLLEDYIDDLKAQGVGTEYHEATMNELEDMYYKYNELNKEKNND